MESQAQQPFIELDREYILEFYENFNDNQLDFTNKWTFPENGSFHARASDCDHRDVQYFVNDGSNITYTGSSAKLTIKRENVGYKKTVDYQPDNAIIQGCENLREFYFTGEEIWSKQGFGYGVYEAKIKFAEGVGSNQSFWLFSDEGYEIDINEFRGDQPWTTRTNYHHFISGIDVLHDPFSYDINNWPISSNSSLTQGYHIHTVKWTGDYINWYIDGALFRHEEISFPSPQHMHIIFGVGVGGDKEEFPEYPNFNSTTFPMAMEVDYVRYWSIGREFPNCTFLSPDNLTVSNTTISNNQTKHIKNTITTSGAVTISSGANVHWTAGQQIELKPGFVANEGANAVFEIIDCNELFGRMADTTNNGSGSGNSSMLASRESAVGSQQSAKTKQKQMNGNETNDSNIKSSILNLQSAISISPNPAADGKFNFNCTVAEIGCMDAEISVMNVLGETIHKEPFRKYAFPMEIDLSSQPKGTYFVKIQNGETVLVYKVVSQ